MPSKRQRVQIGAAEESPQVYADDSLTASSTYVSRTGVGVVFVLFAVFESVVKRLPQYVLPKTAQRPDLNRDFVVNAARYFREELGVPLFNDAAQEEFLRMLSDVRTAVAHATGNTALLNAKVRNRIKNQWSRKYPGLLVQDDYIVISPELVLRAANHVEECLRGVITRLKQAYPRRRGLS